ncbi:MAG: SCP2 sterol-binding domain-containing protein [Oleiphilaceae bacterium]|nr:SCP2 sterol-binding domain-containing protein [Oleiphilaceae bacterium]
MFSTLYQGALMAAEKVLNQGLSLDSAGNAALQRALTGPIQVCISTPEIRFWLLGDGQQLHLQQHCAEPPALEVQGSLLGLLALSLGDRTPLQQGRVVLDGDAALAGRLQALLENLDPDWEGALAERIGDVPAHLLGKQLRRSLKWAREAHGRLESMVAEYLHEESPSLPGRNESEALFGDIAELRLAGDRLEARIQRLQPPPAESGEPQ